MSDALTTTITSQQVEEKDVSQQVAARLKRADDLERAVADLTRQLDDKNCQLGERDLELRSLRALADKKGELAARESELDARERELDLRKELNELKIKNEQQRVADHVNMVTLIFRNSQMRRYGKVPVGVNGGSSQMATAHNGDPIYAQGPGYTLQEDFEETTEES